MTFGDRRVDRRLPLLGINYLVVRFLFGIAAWINHRGAPTVLIENGRINQRALAKELLSESELLPSPTGKFKHLSEIENCVLDPSGTFSSKPKRRHSRSGSTPKCWRGWSSFSQQLGRMRQQLRAR